MYNERSDLADHSATLLRDLALSPFRTGTPEDYNVAASAVRTLATFLQANQQPIPHPRRKPA